jgi:hypothetical protein
MRRIAQMIATDLGRSFPVEHAARDGDIEALVAMGVGHDFATLLNDTWDVFSRYGLLRMTEPSPASTAPTSMEEFIREAVLPAIANRHRSPTHVHHCWPLPDNAWCACD